ncbi:DUF2550 domain-containing protein [Marinitenerispora sediminis]|uniref:DUF2550 domain-containing protein n=1 Tax=Marinitenerispora sediminis TaxID=1931232 RepID=A0A368T7Q3_9ACTN|nr:DUF2550 domain-containing protein [Marinitenerispora sediminis]RCV56158.1 DUF2550 domain-containing protein [Marinitenerispora sediminis]RCV57516.1 DUF2550 domain-containing protein [Marinitenerispora sediminis]RCV57871.1 DUF2550 domain-containing protein [Marinitenerispora sediminis]
MGEPLSSATWVPVAEWLLCALLVLVLLALGSVIVRRFVLQRGGGAVECYLRSGAAGRHVWRIGCARYGTEELRWYRIFSLWPRPTAELSRRGLVVMGRRTPTAEDLRELTPDLVVIQVGWVSGRAAAELEPARAAGGPDAARAGVERPAYELAMTEGALTGFLSWLESMPPGTIWQS